MINRANYTAMRKYLRYQSDVLLVTAATVDRKWRFLKHVLRWADETALEDAPEIRPVLPRYLMSVERGDLLPAGQHVKLSAEGVRRVCGETRAFCGWLRMKWPRRYKALSEEWVSTIQPARMAVEPKKEHEAVSLDMVRSLIAVEGEDLVTRRDRAAAAFLFLSGIRATAFCTLPISCVDIESRAILQYPTLGVRTKNLKAAQTSLLEIADLMEVVGEWDAFVRSELPLSAPWWAVIRIWNGEQRLTDNPPSPYRASVLRKRIKALFVRAGMPPMSPHKFRHGHAVWSLKQAKDIADLKAVSMNLMHSDIGVTDSIYAVLSDDDVRKRIEALGQENGGGDGADEDEIVRIVREVMGRMGE